MKRDNRVGMFSLPEQWVRSRSPEVTRVMGMCSILNASHMEHLNQYNYLALCYQFDVIEPGEEIPWYIFNYDPDLDMFAIKLDSIYRSTR